MKKKIQTKIDPKHFRNPPPPTIYFHRNVYGSDAPIFRKRMKVNQHDENDVKNKSLKQLISQEIIFDDSIIRG